MRGAEGRGVLAEGTLQQVHHGDLPAVELSVEGHRGSRPGPLGLVQAHHQVAGAVLGQLHRLHQHIRCVHGHQWRGDGLRGRRGRLPLGQVDPVALLDGLPDTRARTHRDPHRVVAVIGTRIGVLGRAHQGEAGRGGGAAVVLAHGAQHVVAVGGVVRDGHAVVALGHVHPAVRAGLEAGEVPGGVHGDGAVHVTELDLAAHVRRPHVQRERKLEGLLALGPVQVVDDLQGGVPRAQHEGLHDRGSRTGHAPTLRILRELGGVRVGDPHAALVLADLHPGGGVDVAHHVAVELVDVPGVPGVGSVAVQLQERAALTGGDGLTAGGAVPQGHDGAGPVQHGLQVLVLHGDRVTLADHHHGLLGSLDGARPVGGHAAAGNGSGVDQHLLGIDPRSDPASSRIDLAGFGAGPGTAAQGRQGLLDDLPGTLGERGVAALGVAVHPGDRGARQDVVELVQQRVLPQLLELVVGVLEPAADRGQGGQELGLVQQMLAAPVALLGPGLGGEGAAVQLQVQLAVPHRRVRVLLAGPLEELLRGAELDLRGALEVGRAATGGHHLAGGTTTAVAPAEQVDADAGAALLLEVALEVGQLLTGEHAVVGVGRREVGEHAGAVDALPAEGVVGEGVDLVPGDLLGQEELVTGQRRDLRQCGGVAEGVRQPGLPGLHPEVLQEEPLAGHELAGHGLGAGHVGIRLHPHPAHRCEAPIGHALLDAGEQLGVAVLQPLVLLGGGGGEGDVRVVLDQRAHVGEGAGHLADGLPYRPQPGGVDVGVAGGQHRQGRRPGRGLQHRAQHLAGDPGSAGHVVGVGGVQGRFQCAQDLVASLALLRQGDHQSAQGAHVLRELPDLHVTAGQLELLDPVQVLLRDGVRVTQRGG